jgi:AraC-like DNA-binding protein
VPYWEVRPIRSPEEKFASSAEIHQFGEMALGMVKTPAQWIDRSRYRIARDGFTQFGIQIVRQGHIGKRDSGSDALAKEPGDLLISDLSQCSTLEASNLSALFFSVPRDVLAPLLTSPDHHNQRVIPGQDPLASLLRSHLFALHEQAAHMDAKTVQSVMKPTLELTAAVLNALVSDAEADAVTFALVLEIRRHVERRIKDRRLSAEETARHFGMSPRKLYYPRSIAEIAEEVGFGNYAAFVRAFRKAFEISPRELRALTGTRAGHPAQDGSSSWNNWLIRTR